MRTLVVSDLHLGVRDGRGQLSHPEPLAALSERAAGAGRIVLLGDIVEFRQGPLRDALAEASRVLADLSGALAAGTEVVIVPGNHDHHLLDGWRARRAATGPPPPLGLDDEVSWIPAEPLGILAGALAPARVSVRYPGVWLREDVYATHGHFLDRHITVPHFERLGAGALMRGLQLPLVSARSPDDYEAVLSPLYAWIHALAQIEGRPARAESDASTRIWHALGHGGSGQIEGRSSAARRRALTFGFEFLVAGFNRAGIGPVRADLSPVELRRAGLRAMGEAVTALRIHAAHVVFGHTHRAGPLLGDGTDEWFGGGARLHNTGCWLHEPSFLGDRPSVSPYRAGFCVELDDTGPPRLLNLLDIRR